MPKGIRRDALIQSLHDLHAKYARLADSVQTTLQLLLDEHRTVAQPQLGSVLTEALALDQARRAATNGHGPAVKLRKPQGKSSIKQQRQRSADLLAKFSTTTPRNTPSRMKGSLVRRGYLVQKGDGYLRTAKPYVV